VRLQTPRIATASSIVPLSRAASRFVIAGIHPACPHIHVPASNVTRFEIHCLSVELNSVVFFSLRASFGHLPAVHLQNSFLISAGTEVLKILPRRSVLAAQRRDFTTQKHPLHKERISLGEFPSR
jgi:hypothetical protein